MEDLRCRFCWGENIVHINQGISNEREDGTRLIECLSCERFYWEDSGEEISNLSEICQTRRMRPDHCYEEVRANFNPVEHYCPKAKAVEFNLICSECSKRNFGVSVIIKLLKEESLQLPGY